MNDVLPACKLREEDPASIRQRAYVAVQNLIANAKREFKFFLGKPGVKMLIYV